MILIEDSDDDAILFDSTLRRAGLQDAFQIARRFSNGEQAVEYFLNHSKTLEPEPLPDIVIIDVELPDCSGFEVLARLQPLRPRPVMALFTSAMIPDQERRAAAFGADLFQTKRFEPAVFSHFLTSLARMVDQRRAKGTP